MCTAPTLPLLTIHIISSWRKYWEYPIHFLKLQIYMSDTHTVRPRTYLLMTTDFRVCQRSLEITYSRIRGDLCDRATWYWIHTVCRWWWGSVCSTVSTSYLICGIPVHRCTSALMWEYLPQICGHLPRCADVHVAAHLITPRPGRERGWVISWAKTWYFREKWECSRERKKLKCFVHQDLVQALKSNKEISQDLHPRGKVLTPSLQFRVWVKMGD